ncbi:MAG: hypothetical protein LAP61_28570 [Acidobacteriia bacterium]|nr:hypothetical protein [Terriglobia bacterium]
MERATIQPELSSDAILAWTTILSAAVGMFCAYYYFAIAGNEQHWLFAMVMYFPLTAIVFYAATIATLAVVWGMILVGAVLLWATGELSEYLKRSNELPPTPPQP